MHMMHLGFSTYIFKDKSFCTEIFIKYGHKCEFTNSVKGYDIANGNFLGLEWL